MICPKCKKENPENVPNCIYCGYIFDKNQVPEIKKNSETKSDLSDIVQKQNQLKAEEEDKQKRTRTIVLITLVLACVVALIVGVVVFINIHKNNSSAENAEGNNDTVISTEADYNSEEEEIKILDSVENGFDDIEKEYLVDGYVDSKNIDELLQKEYEYANSLVENGTALSADMENENFCVICKLSQGDTFIYSPPMKELKAGSGSARIVTMQPFYSFGLKSDQADKSANKIKNVTKTYSFSENDNVNDKNVNLNNIGKLKNSKVVIWDGHGGYTKKFHSLLILNTDYKSVRKTAKFRKYCDGKRIIDYGDYCALSSEFFKDYFNSGDLNGAIIYLGTCFSGKDSVLADTLLSKGAETVYGNSNVTEVGYDGEMTDKVFESLSLGTTAEKALKIAQKKNGKYLNLDDGGKNELRYYGNGNFCLVDYTKAAENLIYNFPKYDFDVADTTSNIEIIDLNDDDVPEILYSLNMRANPVVGDVYYFNGNKFVKGEVAPSEYSMYPIYPVTDSEGKVKFCSYNFSSPSEARQNLEYIYESGAASYYTAYASYSLSYTFNKHILNNKVIFDLREYVYQVGEGDYSAIDSYVEELEAFNGRIKINDKAKYMDVHFSAGELFNYENRKSNEALKAYHKTITSDTARDIIYRYKNGEHYIDLTE